LWAWTAGNAVLSKLNELTPVVEKVEALMEDPAEAIHTHQEIADLLMQKQELAMSGGEDAD
jgi:hypothetical protein